MSGLWTDQLFGVSVKESRNVHASHDELHRFQQQCGTGERSRRSRFGAFQDLEFGNELEHGCQEVSRLRSSHSVHLLLSFSDLSREELGSVFDEIPNEQVLDISSI